MLKFVTDLAAALDALRRHAILFFLGITLIALALLGRSWLDAHDASLRLQATLAAQQKTITDADQRQSTRDAQLTQSLAQITSAKQKVQTPTQAAAALPQAVSQLIAASPNGQSLPSPITIELPPSTSAAQDANAPKSDSVARVLEPGASSTNHSDPTNPNGSSANGSPSTAAAKYPWTALKLELAKLGLAHASPAATNANPANKDLENREGTGTSQKGSSAPQSASTPSAAGSGTVAPQITSSVLTNIAEQAKSASNAQTNSPPQASSANATGNPPPREGATAQTNPAPGTNGASAQNISAPPAIIRVPQADLKPLYDAVEDCQACQAKLAAAQGDLSDEKTKFAAATAQRDAAISAARGTFWKRTRTAAKWILIGAAAGAVLSRYH